MSDMKTDKIGFAAFLVTKGIRLTNTEVKNRNRATFAFDVSQSEWAELEQEYLRSDHSRFFEAFKHLRDLTIRGG